MIPRSDAIDCLQTGAEELNQLLGHDIKDDTEPAEVLLQRWLNKTIGAGLDPTSAALFLAHRLAQELRDNHQSNA